MYLDNYGVKLVICIREAHGAQELGPFTSIHDIEENYFEYMIWMSIRDHDDKEIIFLRARKPGLPVSIQIISETYGLRNYDHECFEKFSKDNAIKFINTSIKLYTSQIEIFSERLQSIQKIAL